VVFETVCDGALMLATMLVQCHDDAQVMRLLWKVVMRFRCLSTRRFWCLLWWNSDFGFNESQTPLTHKDDIGNEGVAQLWCDYDEATMFAIMW